MGEVILHEEERKGFDGKDLHKSNILSLKWKSKGAMVDG